jgi:hypothetical protein
LLIVVLILIVIFAALGGRVAVRKGREQSEGFVLGLLFGPLGVVTRDRLDAARQAEDAAAERRERVTRGNQTRVRLGR